MAVYGTSGVGNLCLIESVLNQYAYLNIYKTNLKQKVQNLGLSGSFHFFLGNDPKRKARTGGMATIQYRLYTACAGNATVVTRYLSNRMDLRRTKMVALKMLHMTRT